VGRDRAGAVPKPQISPSEKTLLAPGPQLRHSTTVKVENDNRFHRQHKFQVMDGPASRPLISIPLNKWVRIERLDGPDQDCARLLDLGFTPGEEITVTQHAPLGDPLVVRVRGALLALRKREAAWILVE
jgi:ferrous iron transport protein A